MSPTQQTGHPEHVPGMSAKDEILARLHAALAVPRPDPVTEAADVPRDYVGADADVEVTTPRDKILDLFVKTVTDYRANVRRADAEGLPALVVELLAAHGDTSRIAVPSAVPDAWLAAVPASVEIVRDDPTMPLPDPRALDTAEAVVTGAFRGIASTGTIVLDGRGPSGRRALTLVPDHHVCVVLESQVVYGVPRAIADMNADPARPFTFISGPSATSDIELERVEGVHGPRDLDVILLAD